MDSIERIKAWGVANPQKLKVARRRYNQAHKKQLAAYARAYYKKRANILRFQARFRYRTQRLAALL